MLVDTGADRTVLSADVMGMLKLQPIETGDHLSGAGGSVESTVVVTEIRLTQDTGIKATFSGQYAGCKDVNDLDMSVLGRDILDLFALIVERKSDTICLLGHQHYYSINKR
jgi:predicted aspartyl protease